MAGHVIAKVIDFNPVYMYIHLKVSCMMDYFEQPAPYTENALYMCIDLYQKVKRTVTIPRNLLLQKKFL
jgi:hypothetical protein